MIASLISLIVVVSAIASALFVPVYAQTTTQQPSGGGVSLLSSSQINNSFGSVYVVGEVRNDLSDLVQFVQIVGTFYDSAGVLIDTDYTYTDLDYLRPGEKSPFTLIISDESVAQRIDSYTLSVNWEPVFADPSAVVLI